jgi:hypothetical protein
MFNNKVGVAVSNASYADEKNVEVEIQQRDLDSEARELGLNDINSDYGHIQSYFYVFLFVCLITFSIFIR